MKRETFNRVASTKKRSELWTEACHLEDRSDKPSQRKAVRLLRQAIRVGLTEAQGSLALAYYLGRGVRFSRRMSLQWDRKAWRNGSSLSARNLAITLQREGRIRSAILWFQRAIDAGNPDARFDLARIYLGSPAKHVEARRLLEEYISAGPQMTHDIIPGDAVRISPVEDHDYGEAVHLLQSLLRKI